MSKYYNNTDYSPSSHKRKKRGWTTFLIVAAWVVGILIIVAGGIIAGFAIYFNPDRIKNIIEKESSKYLQADVRIGSLEYKIFSTYPWLQFRIDSLSVISKCLDNIPLETRRQLPVYTDSLFNVNLIEGKVNVHSILHHKLQLKDIDIERPDINIVMVNDSVANFNIAPPLPSNMKVPDIDLTDLKIEAPVNFRFFSLKDDVEGALNMESFYLLKESDNRYTIDFRGEIKGRYEEYETSELPFSFYTTVNPELRNVAVNLENLSVSYANLSLDLATKVRAGKNNLDIESGRLCLDIENIFALPDYLPEKLREQIKLPDGIHGNLPLRLIVDLKTPYRLEYSNLDSLTLTDIPPVSALVKIEDANLVLSPQGFKKIEADDVYLEAQTDYDPEKPEETGLKLLEFRMKGEGVDLAATAEVNTLLSDTQPFTGDVSFKSPLMETLAYFLPKSSFKIGGTLHGDIKFNGVALNFGQEGFNDVKVEADIKSGSLKIQSAGMGRINIRNFNSDLKAIVPRYPFGNNYSGVKLGFVLSLDSLSTRQNGMDLNLSGLKMKLDAMDTLSQNPDPFGSLYIKLRGLNLAQGSTKFMGQEIIVNANGAMNSNGVPNFNSVDYTGKGNDALIESRVSHTPLTLEYSGGGLMQTIINMIDLDMDLALGNGDFITPDYLYPIDFSGLKVSTNLNNVKFSADKLTVDDTGLKLNGEFRGLMPFLNGYTCPLKLNADINFTNVDINRLAWGYYGSQLLHGKDSVFYVAPMTPYTAADSVCVAIPRNIEAHIKLHSDSAQYMQYKFTPLSTDIIVKDGAATLSKLTIGTPYCKAVVDWTYSTSFLSDIYMDLKARVEKFRFKPFYGIFPDLVKKAPEMRYLTGEINADIACRFNMFPSMFMEAESLQGKFDVRGTDLLFAREGKIAKITHLMLIEGDEPVKIDNLNISGAYHDNLLQVNPFKVGFDDYLLSFAGVNNTFGDMYYHIALEKSPFHLPFGVTLKGKFSHPEIRLGGTRLDDYESEKVSAILGSKIDVNIMTYLHHGWLLFVQEAAKYGHEGEINQRNQSN